MKKILFIDRDGTLIREPADEQIDSFEKLEFIPGMITWLGRIARELSYELVMVTNQDGLGTKAFPEEDFQGPQNLLLKTLEGEGISFSHIAIDRSFEADNLPTRKPGTAMLTAYSSGNVDMANSYVIGDRKTDLQLAQNLGCKGILFSNSKETNAALATESWEAIFQFLKPKRQATVQRKTNETNVSVWTNLDGTGIANIDTGLGFFNHMLEQLARHSGIDLNVTVLGDLQVDEHHTVEDTAIVLGTVLRDALGSMKGIERYGFFLPMDDSNALVGLDLGGRSYLRWDVQFKRERIGDVPTELFSHFFRSLTDAAKWTLHVKAEGINEHHLIESIFKAVARSLRSAIKQNGTDVLPSTKGLL
jgi:histidinol-phosphatase